MAEDTNIPGKQHSISEWQLHELLREHTDAPGKPGAQHPAAPLKDDQDPFIQDALEGLSAFSSAEKIRKDTYQINQNLEVKIRKYRRKKPLQISHVFWYIIAAIIIIMAIVLAFAVIDLKK